MPYKICKQVFLELKAGIFSDGPMGFTTDCINASPLLPSSAN